MKNDAPIYLIKFYCSVFWILPTINIHQVTFLMGIGRQPNLHQEHSVFKAEFYKYLLFKI